MKSETKNPLWPEVIMIVSGLAAVAPLVLLIVTSFKPETEVLNFQAVLPREWTWANFIRILGTPEEAPVGRWFLNSLLISSATTFVVLTVSSLAAYALVRLRPPGSAWVLGLLVATMMIPGQVLMVPLYLILNQIGWIDTPMALIFPGAAGAFGTFLLSQFFRGIPHELEEAAVIDGCGRLAIFFHIILPLARPALATLAIFTFIGTWNDFIGPLVLLDSISHYTLPVGIALFQSSYASEYGLTFAASVLSTLPVLVVFLIFQRNIIQSVAFTGIK
jgi:multiple sugar transport system permease protein